MDTYAGIAGQQNITVEGANIRYKNDISMPTRDTDEGHVVIVPETYKVVGQPAVITINVNGTTVKMFMDANDTDVRAVHLQQRSIEKRDNGNGYVIADTGAKVLCNSDPIASWDDAMNWASQSYGDPSGAQEIQEAVGSSKYIGVSALGGSLHHNGQMIIRSETAGFSDD